MDSELGRRMVALGAIGLAIALQGAATAPSEAPSQVAGDAHALSPMASYSLQPELQSSYGLKLLDHELTLTGTSIDFESSGFHPLTAGHPGPAVTFPNPASASDESFLRRVTGADALPSDSATPPGSAENRDSVGAPIVLNEFHTLPVSVQVF